MIFRNIEITNDSRKEIIQNIWCLSISFNDFIFFNQGYLLSDRDLSEKNSYNIFQNVFLSVVFQNLFLSMVFISFKLLY